MITLDLCRIPISYKEGIYRIHDLPDVDKDIIAFEHDSYGDTLTYNIPIREDEREITLYGIPKEEFLESVNAAYDQIGKLKKISALANNEPILVYICYSDAEDTKQEIKRFAMETADAMIAKICMCKDVIARLFVEYYYDRDAMDVHAIIGTSAQKEQLEKEYPRDKDIGDYPGNYPSENIVGDNDTLIVLIKCVVDGEMYEFFQYALNIMEKRIKEKVIDRLTKTDDFKLICMEYD